MTEYHIPIMFSQCMDYLQIEQDGIYFDGTLGGGGHSFGVLQRGGKIIATDRDIEALDHSKMRFMAESSFCDRYTLVKDNFKNVLDVLKANGIEQLDGAILDLGISSHQIDESSRGFSYANNSAILDMRMDRDQYLSAMTVVNEYDEEQLSRIIYTYGEERFARRIAAAIVQNRKKAPIETTKKLAEIIKSNVPYFGKGGHPAKKTFQAIRIEVNNELSGLGEAISDILSVMKKGGRICVITFHSLEDRIVKQTLRTLATNCICDKSLPVCVCNHKASIRLVESKGIKPTKEEETVNSRSKSATLRVAEKL